MKVKNLVYLLTFALVFCLNAKEQKPNPYGSAYAEKWFQETVKFDSVIAAIDEWKPDSVRTHVDNKGYGCEFLNSKDSTWSRLIETYLIMNHKYVIESFRNFSDSTILITKTTFRGEIKDKFYDFTKDGKKFVIGIFLDPIPGFNYIQLMIIENSQERWYRKLRSTISVWRFHREF